MKNNGIISVLGLMSGTSLDGLDLALVNFHKTKSNWEYELIKGVTVPFPTALAEDLYNGSKMSAEQLGLLEVNFSRFCAAKINEFSSYSIDFIASHGHTIFHQPQNGFTQQIGNGHLIHQLTGLPIIYDFRTLDVAKGGQGAPLVPVVDRLLFGQYEFCLNLGGIANISFDDDEGLRRAFDITPCNMILNFIAQKIGHPYDKNGHLASRGNVIIPLLDKWNSLPYFLENPPKSLGYEWVSTHYFGDIIHANYSDYLATSVAHISYQIANICKQYKKTGKILVTGGGAKNGFLITTLENKIAGDLKIIVPENQLIDYKEAIAFAFLGLLRFTNTPNIFASVTGATSDSCSGIMLGF